MNMQTLPTYGLKRIGRASEFDINATVTTGTIFCPICDMPTTNISYRVPEYTRTGETAMNRGVYYSDGTCIDGVSKGNLDDGTPGVDAFYTGYHWTKSVCQNCGTINSVDGVNSYSCGKDVYSLNPCDSNFFIDFDNTSYTPYNSKTHTTDAKKGKYCQFCKGTYSRTTSKQENHNFAEIIDGELGNQRFHITVDCNDCGYTKNEYIAAKSVVQSYYGNVDGKSHSITVADYPKTVYIQVSAMEQRRINAIKPLHRIIRTQDIIPYITKLIIAMVARI